MSTTETTPNINVGCGVASDYDSFEAGRKAARKAISDIALLPPTTVIVFASANYQLDSVLSGVRAIVKDTPLFSPGSAGEIFTSTSSRSVIVMAFASAFPVTNIGLGEPLREGSQKAPQQYIEKELAEQVHFFQTLIDHIPNPVFYKDTDCNYLGCNKAFEEYLEVRREDILGKPVKDIKTADVIELHQKMDEALIKNGGKVVYESMNRPKHGNAHHDIIHKALFYKADGSIGGIIATVTDISDRKHAEEALRTSEEKFLKAFQHNPTMMAITSLTDGRIVEVNESFLKKLGFTRREVLGKTSQDLQIYVYPKHRELVIKTIKEKGSVRNLDVPLKTPKGNILHCLLSLEFIELQNMKNILVLLQDITDHKKAEEERLKRMQLQNALDMAGTICHEFNQPMQILSGCTELLLSALSKDSEAKEKLQIIQEQTERMGEITRKMMALKNYSIKDYAGIGNIMDIHKNVQGEKV